MLYVIWYKKRESRITGSYLVNTKNKKEARQLFKNVIDDDCRRIITQVQQFSEVLEECEETQEEFLGNISVPNEGEFVLIEAGT
jgi:hypothetical protein